MDNFKKNIAAFIFDLGRVLIDFDHHIASRRILNFCQKTEEEIFNLFFDSSLTALFEEGRLSPLEFFEKVKERLELKLNYEDFLPIWNEIFYFTHTNQKVLELAQLLSERYKVLLLSNINILHFEYLKNNFAFIFEPFYKIVLSYEVGVRKPDPLIYETARKTLGVAFEEIFYIDDRKELIEEAKLLGIKGHHFTGIESLLAELGINLDEKTRLSAKIL